ncbi:expansin-B9-like [Oryza brachyantha]|uniref:Expansin-like EG45 domain-containing protein n=1 Tax=Oryza brachyantha TaxID=4533 RepID=J3N4N5_ORYBR|nr:expansin-B9-like [Oryza brachyantha]
MGTLSNFAVAVAVVAALVTGGSCGPPKVPPGPNISTSYNTLWLPARATWYGKATGSGPDDNGGACGIKEVNLPPYNGMISCGNIPIFKDGRGCGSCYEVKCEKPVACSKKPVTVFITDMNYEPISAYHFDLSGKAFGAMALPGKESDLRHAGIIDMQFRRVRCKYPPGQKVVFHVEKGSNPNYLAVLVKFVADDGDVVQMDLQEKSSPEWKAMKESWGAIWRVDTPKPLKGPFSLRVTTESGKKLVAKDVIPEKWKPDTLYKSNIQFY